MDKLKRSDQSKTANALGKRYGVTVVPESVMNGEGLDEIWKLLRQWSSVELESTIQSNL